jgi:preprotein translocase subunit Sec63
MLVDGVSVSIEIQKSGVRKLSMQGRPFGYSVLLTRAQLQQLLEELSLALAPTYYEVLGIEPTASAEQIQTAFRMRAKQVHPDLHDDGEHAEMAKVNIAHEILSDLEKRKAYDVTLLKGAP